MFLRLWGSTPRGTAIFATSTLASFYSSTGWPLVITQARGCTQKLSSHISFPGHQIIPFCQSCRHVSVTHKVSFGSVTWHTGLWHQSSPPHHFTACGVAIFKWHILNNSTFFFDQWLISFQWGNLTQSKQKLTIKHMSQWGKKEKIMQTQGSKCCWKKGPRRHLVLKGETEVVPVKNEFSSLLGFSWANLTS